MDSNTPDSQAEHSNQMESCEHPSWHLELEDDVDPADADGVPVCDNCGERLDREVNQ